MRLPGDVGASSRPLADSSSAWHAAYDGNKVRKSRCGNREPGARLTGVKCCQAPRELRFFAVSDRGHLISSPIRTSWWYWILRMSGYGVSRV
jgi:hypothetical protein